MKLRVWHIPNVPGNAFHQAVDSVEEAKIVLITLARYDLYLGTLIQTNVQGLEVWYETNDSYYAGEEQFQRDMALVPFSDCEHWMEFHDEQDRDISQIMDDTTLAATTPRQWVEETVWTAEQLQEKARQKEILKNRRAKWRKGF
jgi:hypothetical protein